MALDWHILASFLIAALTVQVTPGPGMLFILVNGISAGRAGGVAAAFGAATGMVVHTIFAALGLAALFRAAPPLYDAVRLVGAAYLLWLAAKHLRGGRLTELQAAPRRPARRVYARALVNNLANPKIVMFYVAFLPQFIVPGTSDPAVQFLVLGGLFLLVGLALDVVIGVFAGAIAERLGRSPRLGRLLDRLAGSVLAALGVRLALDRTRAA